MLKILAIGKKCKAFSALEDVINHAFDDSLFHISYPTAEATEWALTEDPDVILLDRSMEYPDRLDTCTRLKMDNRLAEIPIILVKSQDDGKQFCVKALESGADAFLSTPININELTAQVLAMAKIKAANRKKQILSSEEKYRNIFENIQDVYFESSIDGTILEISPSVEKLSLGKYKAEDLIGKSLLSFYPDLNTRDLFLMAIKEKGYVNDFEIVLKSEDGVFIIASINSKLSYDKSGRPEKIIGSIRDITERKKSEQALRKSEQKWLSLVKAIPDYVALYDEKGRYLFLNHYAEGFSEKDIAGKYFYDFISADFRSAYKEAFHKARQSRNIQYVEHQAAGDFKMMRHYESNIVPVFEADKLVNFMVLARDITEHKQAENKIRESEERFRHISSSISDISYSCIVDAKGNSCINWLLGATEKITGYTNNELFELKCWGKLVIDEDLEIFKKNILDARPGTSNTCKLRLKTKDDRVIWIQSSSECVKDKQNNHQHINYGSLLDITEKVLAEQAIFKSEERLQQAELVSLIGHWELHLDSGTIVASKGAASLYGVSQNIFNYNDIKRLPLPEYRVKLDTALKDLIENDVPYEIGFKIIRADNGELRDIHSKAFFDTTSRIVFGIIQDVTEQKKSEEFFKTLSQAIQQSPISILITNANGEVEFANRKFISLTQYSLAEIAGKKPRIFNPGHAEVEEYKDMWAILNSGKVWQGESINHKKNGATFWESIIIAPLFDNEGKLSNYVLSMEDITEKRIIIDDLRRERDRAEESDHLKTAFLHNISHEIRTPMNAIVGFSELLKESGIPPVKINQYTDIIINSGKHLLAIISDIISIATIEAGQVRIAENEINLNEIIKLLHEQLILISTKNNTILRYKTPLPDKRASIITDSVKLAEILINLVGNALKFTSNGFVNYGYQIKDGFIEFYIKDTGIGIPKNKQSEIFLRFRQADDSLNHVYGGTGLGLAISKAYVELLGGKIWVISQPGKGSTFFFTIPYKMVTSENLKLHESGKIVRIDKMANKTILVAEDEDLSFMLIEEVFAGSGLQISRAVNGAEAVEKCRSNPGFDLVLMDIKMPVMDGCEATRQIRAFRPSLAIIAQTAYASEEDKIHFLNCGCTDYISKPINITEFYDKVSLYLED